MGNVCHRAEEICVFQCAKCCCPDRLRAGRKTAKGYSFLLEMKDKIHDDTLMVKSLEGARKDGFVGDLDPYVELKLVPEDNIAGDQKQNTSVTEHDTSISYWDPPERFQFIVTNKENSKIRLTLYNYDIRKGSEPMGDAHLFLKFAELNQANTLSKLTFASIGTGKPSGQIGFEVEYTTFKQACSVQEQIIFEYQRWQPVVGWGSKRPGNFYPNDPKRWQSEDHSLAGDEMDDVAKAMLPSDKWTVQKEWFMMASRGDPDGWSYALGFQSVTWQPQSSSDLLVRRRQWQRTIMAPYN